MDERPSNWAIHPYNKIKIRRRRVIYGMKNAADYTIPVYTREHFAHYKQLCEWYFENNPYKDELFSYHLNQPKHFQRWIKEKPKIIELLTPVRT
jgi:hypothetical protein